MFSSSLGIWLMQLCCFDGIQCKIEEADLKRPVECNLDCPLCCWNGALELFVYRKSTTMVLHNNSLFLVLQCTTVDINSFHQF